MTTLLSKALAVGGLCALFVGAGSATFAQGYDHHDRQRHHDADSYSQRFDQSQHHDWHHSTNYGRWENGRYIRANEDRRFHQDARFHQDRRPDLVRRDDSRQYRHDNSDQHRGR